jgi:hypothetical protein
VEYPYLQKIQAKRGGKDFIILSIDTENRADLDKSFLKELGITFPVVLDNQKISQGVYKIEGTPTDLLIDRQGRIVFRHCGFSPGQETVLDAEISALL